MAAIRQMLTHRKNIRRSLCFMLRVFFGILSLTKHKMPSRYIFIFAILPPEV
jgi:hypothetical protein